MLCGVFWLSAKSALIIQRSGRPWGQNKNFLPTEYFQIKHFFPLWTGRINLLTVTSALLQPSSQWPDRWTGCLSAYRAGENIYQGWYRAPQSLRPHPSRPADRITHPSQPHRSSWPCGIGPVFLVSLCVPGLIVGIVAGVSVTRHWFIISLVITQHVSRLRCCSRSAQLGCKYSEAAGWFVINHAAAAAAAAAACGEKSYRKRCSFFPPFVG